MIRSNSVQKQVLEALRQGDSLTSVEAWRRWGITRLASIIHRLRRAGHEVVTVKRLAANGSLYAEYSMHGL
jgi:GTP1/Obg family GTP-binding protein